MTQLDSSPVHPAPTATGVGLGALLWGRVSLRAIGRLLTLSIERVARGRRLLVLVLLFLLPSLVALLGRYYDPQYEALDVVGYLLMLISNALVPFSALILATGLIQDEIEEQTLTYLLIRPLPKWLIYVAKLLAVLFLAAALSVAFTFFTMAVATYGYPAWDEIIPAQALRMGGLMALAAVVYCAIFAALGLFLKRGLIVGVTYILLFEGVFANIDFVVRKFTILYYIRVIAERWLGLQNDAWNVQLDVAPSAWKCLGLLLAAVALSTLAASTLFTLKEFRLKTPEGS